MHDDATPGPPDTPRPPARDEVVHAIGFNDGFVVRDDIHRPYALHVAHVPPSELWLVRRGNVDNTYWLLHGVHMVPCTSKETGIMGLHLVGI